MNNIRNKEDYVDINEFVLLAGIGQSTLYNYLKRKPILKEKIITEGKKHLYHLSLLKYFISDKIYNKIKEMESEIKTMKSLIDHLLVTNDKSFLNSEWSLFCTVNYKYSRNLDGCRAKMEKLFENLKKHYGKNFILFFASEKNSDRDGYHTHFIIEKDEEVEFEDIKKFIENFFKHEQIDVQKYDKYKGGFLYFTKQGLKGINWDILI